MKSRVYIETTVVSYLTARPSRDIVIAGHQEMTRIWWKHAAERFELVASQLVIAEAGAGDPTAAQERLNSLNCVRLLDATTEAANLSQSFVESGAIPINAVQDAAHIAIAVTNGVEFLVTWNCRHIANATIRVKIESLCRFAGLEPVTICTPEELLDFDDELTAD